MHGLIRPLIVPLILCLATLAACGVAPISRANRPAASNPATVTPATAVPSATHAGLTTGAKLVCTGRMLHLGIVEETSMALTCTVSGASAPATSFQLSATLPGSAHGPSRTYPLCSGTLQAGAGKCARNLLAPSNQWGRSLTVSGALSPGNLALPAATVSTR